MRSAASRTKISIFSKKFDFLPEFGFKSNYEFIFSSWRLIVTPKKKKFPNLVVFSRSIFEHFSKIVTLRENRNVIFSKSFLKIKKKIEKKVIICLGRFGMWLNSVFGRELKFHPPLPPFRFWIPKSEE